MQRGRIYRFESFRLDQDARRLFHCGKPVHLTPKEFSLLALLAENAGRVVSKDEILRSVWHDVAVEEGNLTQTISLLRKVLGGDCGHEIIETIPRYGYLFTAAVKPSGRLFAPGQARLAFLLKAGAAVLFLALWALLFYSFGAHH